MSGFPGGSVGKESICNSGDVGDAGDMDLISGSGRSPGGGHGNPLQYSCLWNSMDRAASQTTDHWVANSWTQFKQLSTHSLCMSIPISQSIPCPLSPLVTIKGFFFFFFFLHFILISTLRSSLLTQKLFGCKILYLKNIYLRRMPCWVHVKQWTKREGWRWKGRRRWSFYGESPSE